MGKFLGHLATVLRHRYFVMLECFKQKLIVQGLLHDLSKFSFVEFSSGVKYFQGNMSPIEAERKEKGFSAGFLHHSGSNKHHWQYWVDFEHGELITCKIPNRYIVEMACDMIGAAKAYNKKNFKKEDPLNYHLKHAMIMEESCQIKLLQYLTEYSEKGSFKRMENV
jgi:hypothetical protein